jgi:histidyl-tRNA synthetase
MYDLKDQGGEICSLRFDLTVPFARWLVMNNVQQIKRYQIAKVYRRDQPAIARGRLREFYQCDFDIAGVYDPMIADAEVLCVIAEVFEALDLDITIKFNHRRILDGLFAAAGVPEEKIRSISSAVDKLDKMPWDEVKKEMVEKGISEEVADRTGKYVRRSGDIYEMLEFLKSDANLSANEDVKTGIDEISLLVSYLEAMDVVDKVSFDLSLARGLDYYTGLIFEVVTKPPSKTKAVDPENTSPQGTAKEKTQTIQVGSIAAGGRYDNLVGMYGKRQIPCVGVSFGVDRIYTILKARRNEKESLKPGVDVYVMALGGKDFGGLLLERMKIARRLWSAGIKAEFAAKVKPSSRQQFSTAKKLPLAVIIGESELAAGQIRLKAFEAEEYEGNEKDPGQLVSIEDLVVEVKKLLGSTVGT